MLSNAEKVELLNIARGTLESRLRDEKAGLCEVGAGLRQCHAAFVSLHRGKELRGCIGQLVDDRELYRVVQQCVVSAALEDLRFPPVSGDELSELSIEISVLTPFHRIRSIEEIEVGRHGLYIARGPSRGLLLPQVATEREWDRITFLNQACRKSGLPESAWQDARTEICTFEAEVFSDSPDAGPAAPDRTAQ